MNKDLKTEEVPWYFNEEITSTYESWYEGKYRKADELEKSVLVECIEYIGGVKTILEVGCGTAHFTRFFEKIGLNAYGLDISPFMLKEAKKFWTADKLVLSSSSFLPIRDKSFDIVCFITCLEYMKDSVLVLEEASRVAKKGLLLGLMNAWSIPTIRRKIQIFFGLNPFYKNAHFYSIREIKKIISKAVKKDIYTLKSVSTVFPSFVPIKSSKLPLGAFLCVAVRFNQ